jgi:hypothetical protein
MGTFLITEIHPIAEDCIFFIQAIFVLFVVMTIRINMIPLIKNKVE